MNPRAIGTVLGISIAVLSPSGGAAVIVPATGIAGVRLGMTQAQVRAVLGPPRSVVRDATELGPFTRFRYRRLDVVFFRHTRATAVFTTRTRERTTTGVGVGSTEAAIATGVPGAICRGPARSRVCEVGDPSRKAARITMFDLRGGRVWQAGVYIEFRGSEARRASADFPDEPGAGSRAGVPPPARW